MSSEGCTNPKCRAYEAPVEKKYVFKTEYENQFVGRYEPQYVTTPADRSAAHFPCAAKDMFRDASCPQCDADLARGLDVLRAIDRTQRGKTKPRVFYFKAGFDGGDIHRENAARMFNKAAEEVTPQERKAAKTASLAVLYGNHRQPNKNGRTYEQAALEEAFIEFMNSRAMGHSVSSKSAEEPCCYGMCVAGNQHSEDCEK
jgi:hypothetical protein